MLRLLRMSFPLMTFNDVYEDIEDEIELEFWHIHCAAN